MATVSSAVGICNLALDTLKQESVANIESPVSIEESLCARWYDVTRRELLRSHPWSFARTRVTLLRNSTAPSFEYEDAYDLPPDFLRLLYIGDDVYAGEKEYTLEGRQILMNNGGASLQIAYVKDVTSVAQMDALFVDALAAELAVKLAPAILGMKPATQSYLVSERDRLLRQVRSINGQENPVKVIHKSDLITARNRGFHRYDRYDKVVA